jgi:hypothetical protein
MMSRAGDISQPPLGGMGQVIEAGVTYAGRKRGAGHLIPVFTLAEIVGASSFHIPNIRAYNLAAVLSGHPSPQSNFATDEGRRSNRDVR